jgi:DNA-binding NtrC family response regulator
VKLLRALEQKTFERVGGSLSLKSDFRVLSATHRDLQAMVKAGTFREDLYFRLAVFPLRVPPLRERGRDIALLARHFLGKKAAGRDLRLDQAQEASLQAYAWPGNVRELQNVIERAALLSTGRQLRLDLALPQASSVGAAPADKAVKLSQRLDDEERRLIEDALRQAEGNQSQAARRLGLERTTLQYKMKKYGLG